MTITIDYGNTNIISIEKSDLTLEFGTMYTLDTDWFRLQLKAIEETAEGMMYPATHNHTAPVDLSGVLHVRAIELLAPYSVEFEDGVYTVELAGSHNNMWDAPGGWLQQNAVQVIPSMTNGCVQLSDADMASAVWNADSGSYVIAGSFGHKVKLQLSRIGALLGM